MSEKYVINLIKTVTIEMGMVIMRRTQNQQLSYCNGKIPIRNLAKI